METTKVEDFAETDCRIEHNGRAFTAGGAFLVGNRITCYAKRLERGWIFTDWHGNQLATGTVSSTWRVGPYATKMHSFVGRLPDGRFFHCRGQGDGMVATGRLFTRSA